MLCKSRYTCKSLALISNFFQLKTELYCRKGLWTYLDHVSKVEESKKLKKTSFISSVSTDYGILDTLFSYLWTLSTVFFLMQVKTDFDTLIFNYILPFLYKSGMISIIYHKYGKSFIKIISGKYLGEYLEIIFNLNSHFLINRLFLFLDSLTNCIFIFEKDLLLTGN